MVVHVQEQFSVFLNSDHSASVGIRHFPPRATAAASSVESRTFLLSTVPYEDCVLYCVQPSKVLKILPHCCPLKEGHSSVIQFFWPYINRSETLTYLHSILFEAGICENIDVSWFFHIMLAVYQWQRTLPLSSLRCGAGWKEEGGELIFAPNYLYL